MTTICVPDTNVFLEYDFFTSIPWREEMKDDEVEVWVTSPVVSELDRRKMNYSDRRRQEIARKVITQLAPMAENPQVAVLRDRERVTLLSKQVPPQVYETNGLIHTLGDDQILAAILYRQQQEPTSQFVLFSGDLNLRLRAVMFGIRAAEPSERLRLRVPLDPRDEEIASLRREVNLLKNAVPKLALQVNGQLATTRPIRIAVPPFPTFDEAAAAGQVEARAAELTQRSGEPRGDHAGAPALNALSAMNFISRSESARYARECREYLSQYRQYLEEVHAFRHTANGAAAIVIVIQNSGRSPAEDVDVEVRYPDGLVVYADRRLLRPPVAPEPPAPPKNAFDGSAALAALAEARSTQMQNLAGLFPLSPERPAPLDWGPRVAASERKVRYHRAKVKHGMLADLGRFFVSFPQGWPVGAVELSYTIHCSTNPSNRRGGARIHAAAAVNWRTLERSAVRMAVVAMRPALVR